MKNPDFVGSALRWHQRFMGLAAHVAGWSKDPSTRVGCVVVGPDREVRSTGFNGFPRGVEDTDSRLNDRELKYQLIVHAEENCFLHAARVGVSLHGCTAYSTLPSCTRCSVSAIQAGIRTIVFPEAAPVPDRWRLDLERAQNVLEEAGVRVLWIPTRDLREELASYAHDAWSGWMRYLFLRSPQNEDGSVTIPEELVKRWHRQMYTEYSKLTTSEQDSDRAEADKILEKIRV
jgi:dCMP deaminase